MAAVNMNITVFWDVNPYRHLQGKVHTYTPKVEEVFYPNIGTSLM